MWAASELPCPKGFSPAQLSYSWMLVDCPVGLCYIKLWVPVSGTALDANITPAGPWYRIFSRCCRVARGRGLR